MPCVDLPFRLSFPQEKKKNKKKTKREWSRETKIIETIIFGINDQICMKQTVLGKTVFIIKI